MKLWLNGRIEDAQAARIAPDDRGLLLGDGVFETMKVTGGQVVRIEAHLARLRRGASVLGVPVPRIDFAAAIMQVMAANALDAAAVRLTLTRGSGPRGVLPPQDPTPTLMMTAAPLPPLTPVRLILSRVTRRNELSPLSGIKSLNYLDNILARQEAAGRGADDAVLLNTQGRIAETTTANLFVVKDGELLTPPLKDGALPGTMRAAILQQGAVERPLSPGDLAQAREIFVTTSLGIRSVDEIEGRPLGTFARAREMAERV